MKKENRVNKVMIRLTDAELKKLDKLRRREIRTRSGMFVRLLQRAK